MRRYADQNTKLGRFLARNGGNLWGGLRAELFAKLYKYPAFRSTVSPFYKKRDPQKWVFLVGCYNSGTTILRDLLEAHPEISALPYEGVKLTDAFPNLEQGGWPRMMYRNLHLWGDLPPKMAQRAMRDWAPWWDKSASLFLEKSIDHATRITWLNQHFPNAHFIAITRNGLAVAEGILRRSKPEGAAKRELEDDHFPHDMIANQWVTFDGRISSALESVPNKITLRYEDLMESPLSELEKIFTFLGLVAPPMDKTEDTVHVGARGFKLTNQNEASLARLDPQAAAKMKPLMRPTLQKHGYMD